MVIDSAGFRPGDYEDKSNNKPMSNEVYAENDGKHCPVCFGPMVNGTGDESTEDGVHLVGMKCPDCGWIWTEIYHLTGYRELKKGD